MKTVLPLLFGLVVILGARHLRNEVLNATSVVIQQSPQVPVPEPVAVHEPVFVTSVPVAGDRTGRRPAASDADPDADEPPAAPRVATRPRSATPPRRSPAAPAVMHPAERLLNQTSGGTGEVRVP